MTLVIRPLPIEALEEVYGARGAALVAQERQRRELAAKSPAMSAAAEGRERSGS
jgi:hypothetical protein